MEKIIKFHNRGDFLNRPYHHSDATIFSSVSIRRYSNSPGAFPDAHVQLQLRDCRHTVEIALHYDSLEDHKNGIHKLDTLLQHITQLKKAYIKSYKEYTKLTKAAKAYNQKLVKKRKKKQGARTHRSTVLAELMNDD